MSLRWATRNPGGLTGACSRSASTPTVRTAPAPSAPRTTSRRDGEMCDMPVLPSARFARYAVPRLGIITALHARRSDVNDAPVPDADAAGRAGVLAADPRDPDRDDRAHRGVRGDLPRAARVVREPEQDLPELVRPQVLLPVHVRVLLQPLRDDLLPDHHPFQTADRRLAGLRDLVLRARAGREHVPEP